MKVKARKYSKSIKVVTLSFMELFIRKMEVNEIDLNLQENIKNRKFTPKWPIYTSL